MSYQLEKRVETIMHQTREQVMLETGSFKLGLPETTLESFARALTLSWDAEVAEAARVLEEKRKRTPWLK